MEATVWVLILPEIFVKIDEIKKGINFFRFHRKNKILSSKSEARRIIANKGFKIDNIAVTDEKKNSIKRF